MGSLKDTDARELFLRQHELEHLRVKAKALRGRRADKKRIIPVSLHVTAAKNRLATIKRRLGLV